MLPTIVIIGGGQAGAQAIDTLRREGFTGRLVLIGDEPELPYQRPPLSKKYLSGEMAADRLPFRHLNHLINPAARRIHLDAQFAVGRAGIQTKPAVDALIEIHLLRLVCFAVKLRADRRGVPDSAGFPDRTCV